MERGLFITFEGIDNCGKSVMSHRLAEELREMGYDVILTRQPGGTALGQQLRQVLLHPDADGLDERAEALVFAADRAYHVKKLVRPALEQGTIVICDRYGDSLEAYQGGGRGMDKAFLRQLNAFATNNLVPDLTYYLAIDYATSTARQEGGCDFIESESAAFFQRVIDTFEDLAIEQPQRFCRIDATAEMETVYAQVKAAVTERLAAK